MPVLRSGAVQQAPDHPKQSLVSVGIHAPEDSGAQHICGSFLAHHATDIKSTIRIIVKILIKSNDNGDNSHISTIKNNESDKNNNTTSIRTSEYLQSKLSDFYYNHKNPKRFFRLGLGELRFEVREIATLKSGFEAARLIFQAQLPLTSKVPTI